MPDWLPPHLRFPVRPVSWALPGTQERTGRWLSLLYATPPAPEESPQAEVGRWEYVPASAGIKNESLGKCVYLKNLDKPQKIRRLIASLEADSRLDVDSMVSALHEATQALWGCSLLDLLQQHAGDKRIEWPS